MPGEAGPPLTPADAASTPLEGVDRASAPDNSMSDPMPDSMPDPVTNTVTEPSNDPASSTPNGPAAPTVRRRHLFALLVVTAVLAYVSDQGTKAIALNALADGASRPFIGDLIRFKLIGNPGAALSLGSGNTWIMTGIALVVLVAILVVAKDLGSRLWALALGLLLGSAVGNLTDRFVRPPGGGQGHVVDFIDYNRWFIGNVADIWIVGAAILIVVLGLFGIGVDGRRERSHPSPDRNHPSPDDSPDNRADHSHDQRTEADTRPVGDNT